MLPARFHKKLWIKRGNYLIVEDYEDAQFVLNGMYEEDNSFLDVNYMLAFVQFKLKNYAHVHELLKDLQNEDFSCDSEL